ncbi:PREDICTED: membrane metallo-endopeptidase-like 1 [Papilio polytes]|uniref:membrane metallo-endopeptidase-like 1 n=1 Tax=Papilio polytes TaxID=76194 RepID=UPI000676795A|nr:PREDICTED: membrane metallo-endopeptidase-like 1 [Papilio polytes]
MSRNKPNNHRHQSVHVPMSGHSEYNRNFTMRDNVKPSFWARRTALEKRLIFISVVLLIMTIGFLVAFITTMYIRSHGDNYLPQTSEMRLSSPQSMPPAARRRDYEVCYTPACIHTASKLLSNMDQSVDPCDEFYKFSCGAFEKNTRIPDDKSSVNTFSIITDQLQEQIRGLLEEPIKNGEARPFVLAKILYKACMNKSAIEARGIQPLLDIMKGLGGWPVLEGDKWNESAFEWQDSVFRFRTSGYSVDYFLDFSISVDVKNSTKRIIDLDQASLGLSREYLSHGLEDKLVKAYYTYMVDIAVLLGANKKRAEKELRESLEFEIALANFSLPLEKRRNATALYNPMTVKELQKQFPKVDWLKYINHLLAPHIEVDIDEVVIVNVPSYITNLEKFLEATPKRVQANYVMWRVAGASISYLTEELRRRQLNYVTALSGKTERESRWKECVDTTSMSMSIAVGALYIRKFFNEEAKKDAMEMVQDIREQFRRTLEEVEWMDEKTRRQALAKADAMAAHIAYPDEMLSDEKLTEFYDGLEMSEDKLMESVLNLTLFGTDFLFKKLRLPVNKTDWITHGRPAIVNAFYSSIENSIQFPAGILQGAFFSALRPAYMNYGAIGFVIGHEITHGFDDQGRQFDKDGNLVDWWQEETKEQYLTKAKCIIDQYSNYTAEEVKLKLNGVNTQGENIADNGGIKGAYYAYEAWTKRHGEEPRLPGLEKYSPKQMFWLSAASTWCSVYRKEAMKLRITTGFHAPGRFRVLGPLSNMEEFSRDFSCPLGSPMNPVNKCKVW